MQVSANVGDLLQSFISLLSKIFLARNQSSFPSSAGSAVLSGSVLQTSILCGLKPVCSVRSNGFMASILNHRASL